MSRVWSRFVASWIIALIGLVGVATAQSSHSEIRPKRNSPYSRFGLGDPQDQFYVAAGGMAGLSAAFQDPFHMNLRNPASLAFLQATSFEVGFNAKYSLLEGGEEDARSWGGNLNYLALGFPLKNPINEAMDRRRSPFGWGMAFALQPYTVVGYDIIADTEGNGTGATSSSFRGTGGTYRVLWSNAFRWKSLSVGINTSYLFGKITNSQLVQFLELEGAFSSRFLDETSYSGLLWEFGAQYLIDLKEMNADGEREASGKRLIIGLFGNGNNSFRTNTSAFVSRFNPTLNVRNDTIFNEDELRSNGQLPAELTGGVVYEESNRFKVGMEYSVGLWSNYENDVQANRRVVLDDTWGVRAGVEYIPDYASYNNYFKRVSYRFGGVYRTDPRVFQEGQLTQYGLTFGLGFPIIRPREQRSNVNFAVEVGRYGNPDTINETYVKMAIGFTLNDNTWFYKRKFN